MIKRVQTFPRGDYVLVIDTRGPTKKQFKLSKSQFDLEGVPPIQKAANFAKASAKHLANGKIPATDEQVEARFAVCVSCPLFKPSPTKANTGECTSPKCGCGLSQVGAESVFLPNKLRWASEACPLGKWPSLLPRKD